MNERRKKKSININQSLQNRNEIRRKLNGI